MKIETKEQLTSRLEEERTERQNTGTSVTGHKFFDDNGYIIIKKLWNPLELYRPIPNVRGQITYTGKYRDQYVYKELEEQVDGSLSVYSHPQYKEIHSLIRREIEDIIGSQLYDTYYYDRVYFVGQELERHLDRDACEISVTVHIGSNLDECWPIALKTVDQDNVYVCLEPGDAMVYKGCERPHWRDPLPSRHKGIMRRFRKNDDTYYHQAFFHYVLSNGFRCQYAKDLKSYYHE